MNSTDLLAILLLLLLLIYKPPLIEPNTELLNIYGEPLVPCQRYSDDSRGSWDNQGYCSETGGSVHQICFRINQDTQSFSSDTGQTNWSEKRISEERRENNHCMCLGAWALYKAKQNDRSDDQTTNDQTTNDQTTNDQTTNELVCESIMDDSLSPDYITNWNTWNGNELDDQLVDGVNALVDQCYTQGTDSQKQHITDLYNTLAEEYTNLKQTETYQRVN